MFLRTTTIWLLMLKRPGFLLRTTPHNQQKNVSGAASHNQADQNRKLLSTIARFVDDNKNRPEMVGSLPLAKSTSGNHADAGFLQQFQAVEHVRGQW